MYKARDKILLFYKKLSYQKYFKKIVYGSDVILYCLFPVI